MEVNEYHAQILQLWSTCLAKAQWDGSLTDCVSLIAKQKSEKTSNEEKKADAQALKDMHSQGKDALAAEKACITVEKVAAEEAKKTEKLRAAEEKKAKKAQDAELKWLAKSKGNPTDILADSTIQNGLDGFIVDILDEAVGKQDETDGKCILHPNDLSNFLKLCATICLLIKNTITDQEVSSTDTLLQEYCMELIQLYRLGCLKPNHHYATHVSQYIHNFGPLSGFWTFLFEHLNKILKTFKTNNHRDGELETTFFNEFHQMCQSSRLMPMGKFLMFSTLTKIFTIKDSRCTLFACNGSDDGTMKRKLFGKCCVCLWELKEYINMDMLLPPLIDPTWIQNHIALKTVSVGPNHEKKGITCTAENICMIQVW
ncbi:hypothetical protein EDC04DRAFT_2601296 [Pisolithus marmoratus]|nr:hypothetical protein EDC04DRAFT_2601296 [Pisolithus marmoratus]